MVEVRPDEVSAILRQQLSGFKSESELEEVGTVLQVGDGIARVYGLTKVQSGELVEFENGLQGIVLNLEEDNVGTVVLGSDTHIQEGDTVILKKTQSAESGDIVVALIDDEEATLKRLRKKGQSIALEPANSAFETRIFGPDRVKIQGKLVVLVRRY